MAQKFILTAQLRLAAPTNVAAIVNSINAGLRGINVNVKINTNGVNQQLNVINKTLNGTSKAAKTAANDMERFGEQAAVAIRRYGAFTLATTAFIKLTNAISGGIDDAIKFDREMVRLAQVTGASVSGVKDLGDEVTRLAKNYGVASTEILEASVTLAQAGISAKNIKVILESIAKTGVSATFGNIKNTTEAVIAAMQQFNLKAEDMEDTLSSINSVSAKFAVEASDITTAIVRTGGAFQAAGGNIKEFQALFTSVRQTTRESAETIATGFRTIFTRLQRSRTQNFLQSLGIDLKDAEGQFAGPYEAIRRLSAALKDLKGTDPRFAQIIEELGGFRQISKVIPLITKFDVAQQALNVALRSGSSLTKDAEVSQQALAIQMTKVREEFLALVRNISNNTAFRGFIDLTLRLTSSLIKLADSLQPIIPLLGAVGAIKIGAGFGSFAKGFGRKFSDGGTVHKFATGGLVPGQGNGDTVSARLTPGEFVVRKAAVQAIGADNLQSINSGKQKFAFGGVVKLDNPIGTKAYAILDDGVEIPVTKKQAGNLFGGLTSSDKDQKAFLARMNSFVGRDTDAYKLFVKNEQRSLFGGLDKDLEISKKAQRKIARGIPGQAPKTHFGKFDESNAHGVVLNVPDIITADPSYFGHSKQVSFGTSLKTLGAASSSSVKSSEEIKKYIAKKLNVPDNKRDGIKLTGKTNIHGFLPDIGEKFVANIRPGIAKLIDDTVESLGIKDVIPNRSRNLDTLISESAEQSMKGILFEGVIRSVNKDFSSRNGSDAVLDFTNPSADFSKLIAGAVKIPADAKVSANNTDVYSAVLKGLKAHVSTVQETGNLFNRPVKAALGGLIRKFAFGGHASGTDTVPAMLTPGEFVINKSAAQKLGPATLNKLNHADKYANGGVVRGYASGGGIISSITSNPLALGLLASSLTGFAHQLSGGNKALEKFTTTLSGIGFEFGVFKTIIDGVKSSVPKLHGIKNNDTRSQEKILEDITEAGKAAREAVIKKINKSNFTDDEKVRHITRFNQAQDKRDLTAANAKFDSNKFARRFATGSALFAAAGSIGGDLLTEHGNKLIAQGKDGTKFSAFGGALAGAGQGAAIGAIAGPYGAAIGAVIGGLAGFTTSLKSAQKELENVKFAKQMDEFTKVLDNVVAGKRSISDSKGFVINNTETILKQFLAASPDDAKNIKAGFGNEANKIEQIISTIAKDAKSFDDLEASTKNLLVNFAILTDLPFSTLKDQLVKQIDAQKKAIAFSKTTNKRHEEEARATLALTSMTEAINKVATSFSRFDNALNSASAFLDGHGATSTTKDISGLLEKAGKGHLSDPSELVAAARHITAGFGNAGKEQVAKLEESSKLLAQLPNILLEAKNNTGLGTGEGTFEKEIVKILEARGFKNSVNTVVGGVRTVIGAEGKDEKIIDEVRNNLGQVASEVGKPLQATIDAFKEFAPAFKEHGDRINKAFEIYEKAQEKISDIEQQQIGRRQTLLNLLSSAYDITRGHQAIRGDQLQRVAAFSGGVTDVHALEAQLRLAQANSEKFGNEANNAINVDDKTRAQALQSEANIKIKETTKALQELANVSENLSEIQKQLAEAESHRAFKADVLKTAVFGSKEAKKQQERTIAATGHALRFGIDSPFLADKDREGVLRFLEGIGKGKLGNKTGEEHIQDIVKNSLFGQAIGKNGIDEILKKGHSPEAQALLKAAGELTKGANDVAGILKKNAEDIGKNVTKGLDAANQKFLTELKAVFIDSQVRQLGDKRNAVKTDLDTEEKRLKQANKDGITDRNRDSFSNALTLLKERLDLRKEAHRLEFIDTKFEGVGGTSNELLAQGLQFAKTHGLEDKNLQGNLSKALREVDEGPAQDAAGTLNSRNAAITRVLRDARLKLLTENTNKTGKVNDELNSTEAGQHLLTRFTGKEASFVDKELKRLTEELSDLSGRSITDLTKSIDALREQIKLIDEEEVKLKKATGGHIPGIGNTDTVPAMLTPGEFVMRKSAVDSIGVDTLSAMNNGYNTGGVVRYFAEGGEVSDIDKLLSPRALRKIQEVREKAREVEVASGPIREAVESKKRDQRFAQAERNAPFVKSEYKDPNNNFADVPVMSHTELTQKAFERFGEAGTSPDKKRLAGELELVRQSKKSEANAAARDRLVAQKAVVSKVLSEKNASGFTNQIATNERLAEIHKQKLEEAEAKNAKLRSSDPLFRRSQQNEANPSFNMKREEILKAASERRAAEKKAEVDAAGARMSESIAKQNDPAFAKTDADRNERIRKQKVFEKIKADTEAAKNERLSKNFTFAKEPGTDEVSPERALRDRAKIAQQRLAERTGRADQTPEAIARQKLEKQVAFDNAHTATKKGFEALANKELPVLLPQPAQPKEDPKDLAARRAEFFKRKFGDDGVTRSLDGKPLAGIDLTVNADIAKQKRKEEHDRRAAQVAKFTDARHQRIADIKQAKIDRIEAFKKRKEDLKKKAIQHHNTGGLVEGFAKGGAVGKASKGSGGRGKSIFDGLHELGQITQKFSTVISTMTDTLSKFKDISITLKATHAVDVTFNGAEAFKSMSAEFEKMAVAETKKAINNMLEAKFPNVGKME